MKKGLPDNIDEIIEVFNSWYESGDHLKREDKYQNDLTSKNLKNLSNEGFVNFFTEFFNSGGGVQSQGHRNIKIFEAELQLKTDEFRKRILEPFEADFDLNDWLSWVDTFKGFGKGISTIYLNKVDKKKYCVLNSKSISAYAKLGYNISSSSLKKSYQSLLAAESDLISKYPDLDDYDKADSLSHFLIGTDRGKNMLPTLMKILTDDELRSIADSSAIKVKSNKKEWISNLSKQIEKYNSSEVDLTDTNILLDLFNSNAVCATGQANSHPIVNALNDEEFRKLFSEKVNDIKSKDNKNLEDFRKLYDELIEALKQRCGKRPKLKLSRALCALFPENISVIGNVVELKNLHDKIFDDRNNHPVEMHFKVFNKLNDLLGPIDRDNIQEFVERMILPWQIYSDVNNMKKESSAKMNETRYSKIPLNQILYGPPGTGKTYNTVNKAVEIIDPEFMDELKTQEPRLTDSEIRNKVKIKFDEYLKSGEISITTFHQSYGYEDFIEGIKVTNTDNALTYSVEAGVFKALCDKARIDKGDPYIIIIDEINRGNISKIFGELITLIEPDKREGEGEALAVMLPYSKTEFSVPSNVHIIGTMNTADASIAKLDVALRRRFDFIEMPPKPELLENIQIEGVNLGLKLTAINSRIELLYDRDHTIGHSFFMKLDSHSEIEDLAEVFKKNIIPLLQEYFFDDWQRIHWVLGDHLKSNDLQFIQKKNSEKELKKLLGEDWQGDDAIQWQLNEEVLNNSTAYISIYDTVVKAPEDSSE